eukprot:12849316-Alexandrium_andersonii.AAC.1
MTRAASTAGESRSASSPAAGMDVDEGSAESIVKLEKLREMLLEQGETDMAEKIKAKIDAAGKDAVLAAPKPARGLYNQAVAFLGACQAKQKAAEEE